MPISSIVKKTLKYEFFEGTRPVIDVNWTKGPGKSKLIIAAGENASGKSLYRRLMQQYCSEKKIECIHISVEGRRNISYSLVYGDETNDSTGCNSAGTILGGIKTSKGRGSKHVVVFDEPDLGMSEGASMGAGTAFAEWLRDPPEHLVAAVIISHSRYLLKKLEDIPHHFLHFGNGEHTIESWVTREVEERSLEDIKESNITRYRGIQKIIDKRRKERENAKR